MPRPIAFLLTVLYLGLVALATLGPQSVAVSVFNRAYFVSSAYLPSLSVSDLEFGANVAMFVPLGFLFALLLGRRYWAWAIVIAVLLTCAIEFTQSFLPMRVTDTRDLIANSGGAVIGVFLGWIALLSSGSAGTSRYRAG